MIQAQSRYANTQGTELEQRASEWSKRLKMEEFPNPHCRKRTDLVCNKTNATKQISQNIYQTSK